MTAPLKPSDMELPENQREFPDFVIVAFNQCIRYAWDGQEAKIRQDTAVQTIADVGGISHDEVFEKGYLDIEPFFRAHGWSVEYDNPAYNENYEAFFTFKSKK